MAEQFDASGKKQMLPFKLLYRNRTSWEFEKIKAYGGNVMYTSLKDASGDERSPINGKLKGLSFCPNVDAYTLEPPTMSPFGNTRLSIHFRELLDTCNLYFTDFYCMKATGPHYITLVAAEKDSIKVIPLVKYHFYRLTPKNGIDSCTSLKTKAV